MYRLMKVPGALALLRMLATAAAGLLFYLKARVWAALSLLVAAASSVLGRLFERHDMATAAGSCLSRIANVFSCAVLAICVCLP